MQYPKSLCLFEEPYEELKLHWTPTFFINRICEWLTLTSKGKLHNLDQPLEPLLLDTYDYIMVPPKIFDESDDMPVLLSFKTIRREDGHIMLIADQIENVKAKNVFSAICITVPPQTHGIISHYPNDIYELHGFLSKAGTDLLNSLRGRFQFWQKNSMLKKIIDTKLVILLKLPKTRSENAEVESIEIRAFYVDTEVKKIGAEIGVWELSDGEPGYLCFPDVTKNGDGIKIYLLNVCHALTREFSAMLNGSSESISRKITLIGAGALGSQVFLNLVRSGYGKWTVIDDDIILPHNLARHALLGDTIGYPKAVCLAHYANITICGENIANSIVDNVLNPVQSKDKILNALTNTDVILDISTSISVERYISLDIVSNARRVSMFLNPLGDSAVMFVEDSKRGVTLDYIEMQYYRYILGNSKFEKHLQYEDTGRIRYANSCRDVSSRVPHINVALFSAICAKAFKEMLLSNEAKILIWNQNKMEVNCNKIVPKKVIKRKIGEWTLYTDDFFLEKVFRLRSSRLPNETGGILMGSFDMNRKIVYIIDTMPSPPDSKEWPTVYIRGCVGLRQKLEKAIKITAGGIEYVGEWHSHPNGYGVKPSSADYKAFCSLTDSMSVDGYPAIMLIVGEKDYSVYIGEMQD